MTLERLEFTSIWVRDEGEYVTDYVLIAPEESGIGERTRSAPGVTTIRGRNADNNFTDLAVVQEAPGDTDTFNVEFYGHYDVISDLEKYKESNRPFNVQLLSFSNPPVDIRSLAKKVEQYSVLPGALTLGAGRNRDGSGGLRSNSIALNIQNRVDANLGISLSRVTNANDTDAMSVMVLDRNIDRTTGWRGADKVIYVGMDDDTTNPGEIYVSVNGGGTFAALATDADPFTNISGVNNLEWNIVSETQFRIIAARETIAAVKAMFAYGDVTFGAEATAPTWTVVTIAATAVTDAVEAMLWPKGIGLTNRLYIAAAGDIYVSTDLGATDPGAAIFTGANALAQFKADFARNIWAVGAANTILVELANQRGTFVARTGPSGGGAFTAFDRAKNGVIYAGNAQSLYRNTNEARSAGSWTAVKDFGAGFTVKSIDCVNGSSEVVRVVASSATAGQVWYTINGGLSWTMVTVSTNSGYLKAAKTSDPN
jgi:hypothetical protein